MIAEKTITLAVEKASTRIAKLHDSAWILEPIIEIVPSTSFFGSITFCSDLILTFSDGCYHAIKEMQSLSAEHICEYNCLDWIMLHELSHFSLGHFELFDCFEIVQRSSMRSNLISTLPLKWQFLVPPCLEMQADHEATMMLLGPYSADGWQNFRQRVLAISSMMMLIELEDARNGAEGRTHPKAATRIFQLLGHLAEMPQIRAQLTQDTSHIPHQEELQTFAHEVTIPCIFDAIQLANSAGAMSIADDIGSPENFFKDLEIAKLGDPSLYSNLKTQGAQQWAELWPCNEALKSILRKN